MKKLWFWLKKSIHAYKGFLGILLLTAVVWVFVSLSETKSFPLKVSLSYTGYNDAQYTVIQSDTTLLLTVESNGFNAIGHHISKSGRTLKIDVSSDRRLNKVISVRSILDTIEPQLSYRGIKRITSAKDSLYLVLKPLTRKAFSPNMSDVEFTFAEQYGLCGEPKLSPDTIYLYGSEESLSQINELRLMPSSFNNIYENATFDVAIDTSWKRYPDVRSSVDKVRIFVPIEPYTERVFELPVVVKDSDSTVRLNLYPSKVAVTAWVPQRSFSQISNEMFTATVDYADVTAGSHSLVVRLSKFPSMARVKKVEPAEIQYVIIK